MDVCPPALLPGLTSKTAMPYPVQVSRRADHVAVSTASAPACVLPTGTRGSGPGGTGHVMPLATVASRAPGTPTLAAAARGVLPPPPPLPSTRCTVPWLVSNTPL